MFSANDHCAQNAKESVNYVLGYHTETILSADGRRQHNTTAKFLWLYKNSRKRTKRDNFETSLELSSLYYEVDNNIECVLFIIYSFENCIVLDKLFHIYASSLIVRYMVFFVQCLKLFLGFFVLFFFFKFSILKISRRQHGADWFMLYIVILM